MESPSIGYFATNFLMVVAIDFSFGCFASFSTSCFVGLARKVGSTEKDSDSFGFSIDYCKDLKIVENLEAYLVLKPMVTTK